MTKQLLALHSCLRVWACVWRRERWSKSIAVILVSLCPLSTAEYGGWRQVLFFLSKDATCTISSCVTFSSNAVARGHSWSDIHSAVFQYNTKLNFSNHWRGFSHQSTTHFLQAEICDPICLCTDHSETQHTTASISASSIDWHMTFSIRV